MNNDSNLLEHDKHKKCKEGPADLTSEEAQQIVDLLNKRDTRENTEKILTPKIAQQILLFAIAGMVQNITYTILEPMLELLKQIPRKEFDEIVTHIDTDKLQENNNRIHGLKNIKDMYIPILAIQKDLLNIDNNGWTSLDDFYIATLEYQFLYGEIFKKTLAKILGIKWYNLAVVDNVIIHDFTKNAFLAEKDPKNRVLTFAVNVINSINKFREQNPTKFSRDHYHLNVIYRYPETDENCDDKERKITKISLIIIPFYKINNTIEIEAKGVNQIIFASKWKNELKEIVKIAIQMEFNATDNDRDRLIKFYNLRAESYLNGEDLKDIFDNEKLFFLFDVLIRDALTDCKDINNYKRIVREIIDMVFEKIRSKNKS